MRFWWKISDSFRNKSKNGICVSVLNRFIHDHIFGSFVLIKGLVEQTKKNCRILYHHSIMGETSPGAHHSAKSNGSLFLETFTLEYFVTIEIIKIQITQADDNGLLVLHETICKLKISTEIDIIS